MRAKPEEAGKIIGASVVLFLLIGVVITFLMELCAVPVARIMQTPPEAFDATVMYVRICSAGSLFIVAYNVLGSIFRGIGDSRMPLITVAIACVFNIAGDFLLVGVFGLATAGAAIATVCAQALSVVISILIIRKKKLPFSFGRKDIVFDKKRMGSVFRLGLPIAFQDLLVSISFLAITAIVNSLGVIPSAGVGVAEKLCGFIMLVPSAFNQSMSAFVAQNMGAGKAERAKKALFTGWGFLSRGGVHGLARLFPRRSAGGAFCQGCRRYCCSRGISEGLCHRLSAGIHYVLYDRIFQRLPENAVCHDPGNHGGILCQNSRISFHEPAEAGIPV